MRLDRLTWLEVEHYLERCQAIVIPTGSTEQHGPMGLIGTDAICAETIAASAADRAGVLVAPTLAITPAPFNLSFPGTVSISAKLFGELVGEIIDGLGGQGFGRFYVLNGHGANLGPLRTIAAQHGNDTIRVRSWWDFEPVSVIRREHFGDWEGMHATPSEIAITQVTDRVIEPGLAAEPPKQLSPDYIAAHAGDRHGPPDEHRARFPDGRVGSHSALASPQVGRLLLDAAVQAVADDIAGWLAA